MDIFYAFFLGVLQGATEFLPISSSAHLALAETYLGIEQAGLSFDIALHVGTLVAVGTYFRNDFFLMGKAVLAVLFAGERRQEEMRLFWLTVFICLATVPAVIVGVLFNDAAETVLRQPVIIAATLAGGGLLLLWADKIGRLERGMKTISLSDALLIGLAQALAIVPGVSRSGITITAGLFRGLDRQAVARFSFMLSTPVILGAGVYNLPDLFRQGVGMEQLLFLAVGFFAAAISGYAFIALLFRIVRGGTFLFFVYYRFLLAGLLLLDMAVG